MKQNLYTHKIHVILRVAALNALFILLFSSMAFAQGSTVKGRVTDAVTNEPIPGATVKVKQTNTAVSTDSNGDYSIAVNKPAVLVFSFIGYAPKEVAIVNQEVVNIKLTEETQELGEVKIVTALGVTKEKRAVGYSVSTVKGASLTEVRQNSFVNSLEGRVAGVNVSGVASGPNGASNVIIRGLTSLTGANQPLYVLNGIPLVNNNYTQTDNGGYGGHDGGDGIGDINPDDIENVSILKGAAATALYGYRGANGVVIITTKKGKSGNGLGIELNSNFVTENVIDNTDFQTKYGQGYNFAKPINAGDAIGSMESSWGALLDGSPVQIFNGTTTTYSEHAKGNMARFYRAGTNATNTLSFSKGFGDDGNTRFSVSELQNNSYVPNSGLQRFTFTQNTELNFGKHINLTLSSQYNSEYTKNPPGLSDAVGNLNWGPMFVPPNIDITNLKGAYGNGTQKNGYELDAFSDIYTTNPYFAAYEFQGATHRNRFIGSIDLKYTADNGFYVKGSVADDYTNDRNTTVTPTGTGYELDGEMQEQNVKQTELNIDLITGKEFKVSNDFKVTPLLGVNYRESIQEYVTASGHSFATPFLYTISNLQSFSEAYEIDRQKFQSVYGSVDFSYKDWLYLTATGRDDWYSTLAPSPKINYLYPSLSASFVYSSLFHIPDMDLGKLRVSYADVGGEADGSYRTLLSYGIQGTIAPPGQASFPVGPGGGGSVPNSALRPSSRREWEIGTEDDFFGNRLRFDLAVYHKNVINDILPVSIDNTSGYTSAILNVGNVRDVGVELALGGTPIKTDKFSWDIDFNGSHIDSKVISLGGQPNIYLGSVEGDWTPDGNSIAHVEQIVGQTPSQIITFTPLRTPKTNKIVISKNTGAPIVASRQTKDFGSAINPWTGGVTNSFRFGNLSMSFLIDGKFGGKLFSNTNYVAYVQGLSKETLSRNPAGYGTAKLAASDYYSRWANADPGMFVYDASFIKFRAFNIGYNFPAKMFHNKIQGINLSFVCHNVFTIMKRTPNIDPESNYSQSIFSQGLEGPDVPYSRTVGLNLNVKF